MIEISSLTHVIAALNGLTAVMLIMGYWFIHHGNRDAHRICMISALLTAVVFVIVYVYYHSHSGLAKFGGEGGVRTVYFSLLATHVAIAAAVLILAPITAIRAIRGRLEAHRRIAHWTFGLWLYVSLTGVVVYIMAVHIYPNVQ